MLSTAPQIKSDPQTLQDFRRNGDTSLSKVELCPNLLKIEWGEGITARIFTPSAIRCKKKSVIDGLYFTDNEVKRPRLGVWRDRAAPQHLSRDSVETWGLAKA